MARYIDVEDALKIIDSYAKTVTSDGKVVVDAIRDIVAIITPTADVVPKKEIANVLRDLKITVHNKAYHTNTKDIPTYVTLKTFDAVVQDLINKYDGRK